MEKSLLVILILFSFESGLGRIALRSLSDVSIHNFEFRTSKPFLIVFFQKDCQVCQKQVKSLQCLPSGIEVFLLGVFSTEEELRREYKKMKTSFPAYYGDQEALDFFGITEKLTPQIVVFNGAEKLYFSGLQKCTRLKRKFFGKKKHG